ncbi:MAG: hypothetical protein SFU98_15605 [Leptospiraceae bacterium]|nr:hypothetical protein [Leptospiraceae bacterium]
MKYKSIITFIIYLILTASIDLYADIMTLKNGTVLKNVKTKINRETIIVTHQDSKQETYSKTVVKSIKIKPIIISSPKTEAQRLENEKEKVRVSESLKDTSEWELDEDKKINFAVMSFKAGKGVEPQEVDIIVDFLSASLVQTKLFNVLDREVVIKAMNEKGGEGCSENPSLCKVPITSIAESLNATKFLSGTVNKLNNKYYIKGTVLDTYSNKIDFAEVVVSNSANTLPESSDYFAKKIAGGMFEFLEASLVLKEGSNSKFGNQRYPKELLYSAIIPGLGQWKKDHKRKAFFLGGFTLLGLFAIYSKSAEFNSEKQSYESTKNLSYLNLVIPNSGLGLYSQIRSNELISNMNQTASELQIGSTIIFLIYAYNLFDAYYTKNETKSEVKTGFKFHLESKSTTVLSESIFQKEIIYNTGYQWSF